MSYGSDPIFPRHSSIRANVRLRPKNMERLKSTPEQSEMLERQALSIFVDCTNANMSFRSALSAILATGMHWGIEASRDIPHE
jgi:hypothetical protein